MNKSLFFFLVLCFFQVKKVLAAPCSTTSAGNWNLAAKWSCGNVPLSTDNATIIHNMVSNSGLTFSASQQITLDNNGKLTINGNLILETGAVLTINNGGSLTITGTVTVQNGAQLIISGGTVTVAGTVTVQNHGPQAKLTINSGSLAVTGNAIVQNGGQLIMNGGTATITGSMTTQGGGATLPPIDIEAGTMRVGTSATTAGTTTLNLMNGTLINKGTLIVVNGNFIESNSSTVSVVNSGTFTVAGTSTIGQKFTNTGTFTTTGNLTISTSGDANLTTTSPGSFSVGGNLTNDNATSGLTIGAGSTGTVTGTFINNGPTTLNGQLTAGNGIINNTSNSNIIGGGVLGWTGTFTTGNGGKITPPPPFLPFTTAPNFNPFSLRTGGLGALPIVLLRFAAHWENNHSILNWVTVKEDNFDFFVIESSTDAKSFHEIGRVKGNGNKTKQKDYSFTDPEYFSGLRYYRLKSVDLDGSAEYFKIVSVKAPENILIYHNTNILIYPNPLKDQPLYILIQADNAMNRIVIYNKVGSPVFESDLQPGLNEIQLQNKLKPDVYYTIVTSEAGIQRSKLVVE